MLNEIFFLKHVTSNVTYNNTISLKIIEHPENNLVINADDNFLYIINLRALNYICFIDIFKSELIYFATTLKGIIFI